MRTLRWILVAVAACAASQKPASEARPDEPHLREVRRLTHGGQNAEAYWSFDGKQLSFQARAAGEQCDRIYRMKPDGSDSVAVSSGNGATTCAYFLPGDQELIYASTHLGADACPPRPDLSKGYVWAIYPDYDIFKVRADGSGITRLTDAPGYDAEGTVCARDGSIVFTSVRDGDLDLYRMDRDGKNVRRLTNVPGYDGGAFFNADCSKIVWRASRPKPGPEMDEYKALLREGLVKPGQLEIWVANPDGSDPVQVTYLGAASFAPSFFPDGKRIIFSSNYGDRTGREFDLWAIGVDGTGLERITAAPGFDGFPLFSPDGKWLAFSSNRAFAPGVRETDVYVARWADAPTPRAEDAPDRILRNVAWLADPAREGRGLGTAGLDAAGAFIEDRFREIGLQPAGDAGGYRQTFDAPVSVRVEPATAVLIDGAAAAGTFSVAGFSASGDIEGEAVLAGYGISDTGLGRDDYAGLEVKGRVAVVRRFVPESDPKFAAKDPKQRFGDLRFKAWIAREHGAKALVVVDWPEGQGELPDEARLPQPRPETSDAGIPVVIVQRSALQTAMPRLMARQPVPIRVRVALTVERKPAFNVVGRIAARAADKLDGAVLVGAHYDHLGMGGRFSLAPDRHEVHPGADDNASGVAAILETARELAARSSELRRDVIVVAFAGEETGLLGSTHFTRSMAAQGVAGMLNLDMVGRMRGNRLSVLGSESALEWAAIAGAACDEARVECALGGDGYGPSDQTPFYGAGVPVLHFFTGAHSDYHKPSDVPGSINAAGAARVARIVARVAQEVGRREQRLGYRKVPAPAPQGDVRSFGASLGTIPDYAGPPDGQRGMLLADVRPGGAADLAGMRRGDILIRLGKHDIAGVEDLMFVLNSVKPGETVRAVVLRGGKEVTMEATFQEGRRSR
ncbi:MAG: M20/M25/M40 family metallo-hydrolase [Deltaproteobacteria bacterium]|nr:MAG: M20/M25/M40 family metallo-hydrolase [Deltaproteobacteria bacterium]